MKKEDNLTKNKKKFIYISKIQDCLLDELWMSEDYKECIPEEILEKITDLSIELKHLIYPIYYAKDITYNNRINLNLKSYDQINKILSEAEENIDNKKE